MKILDSSAWVGIALLGAATLCYLCAAVPAALEFAVYNSVAVGALALAFAGLVRHRPRHRAGWTLALAGFAGWVVGDLVYSVEQSYWNLTTYPVPSDAAYIGSYLLLGAGVTVLVRTRNSGRDVTALLDALIIACGTGILAAVFLIAPLASDSSLSFFGKVVSSAYPLADLALLVVLVRLWATPGARTASFRLLGGALLLTFAADAAWNVSVVASGDTASSTWNDALWLGSYVLVAAAAWTPSMRTLAEPAPRRDEQAVTGRRMAILSAGLMLPGAALLLDGGVDGTALWPVVGVGSLVLSVLVLARMRGLLSTVQVQAVRLAALARADALTGAPNRRTWDHELSRACQVSRDETTSLCVALLDLDHFKTYNDTHGHQAGDRLLREAVAAWTGQLEGEGLLARYGGEEFALLLPGLTPLEAQARVQALAPVTPGGQTFSAGVAMWDPSTEPGAAVAAADEALYQAKRSGRDRVVIARADQASVHPPLRIALQTIVNLRTGEQVAVEALSRFDDKSPLEVFEQAHRDGSGPRLEAAAIRAALAHRHPERELTINVSVPALFTSEVAEALPHDLTGLILEITEYSDTADVNALHATIDDLRGRGARIAIDDWGQGFSNLDRILSLQPEIVKLDMSLIQNLHSGYHRAVVRAITAWADEVGARVCAEGVETAEQWTTLTEIGVHTGQGYLFGRPTLQPTDEGAAVRTTASPT